MTVDFDVFNTIKEILKKNNEQIHINNDISLVYLGFCVHFISCLDAYKLLYENENYYACKSIDRMLIDLYMRIRFFNTVDNPKDLAKQIIEDKYSWNIKKLCENFDKEDDTYSYFPGTTDKVSEEGKFERRYKDDCSYIHPSKKYVFQYFNQQTIDDESNEKINQDDAEQFIILATEVVGFLSNILKHV